MNVLVAGGTGFIGTNLCRELIERGHDVTALSRTPENAPDGVETAVGDVSAADSIADAVEGHDVVVNLVALSPLWKPAGGNEMHDRIHRQGTENLVRAAEDADVDRFIQMSGLGTNADVDMAFIKAKREAEEIVRESDLEYVIFRPSIVFGEGSEIVDFTVKLKQWFAPIVPIFPLPGGGDRTYFQLISVNDLVPMLADGVEDDKHANETYELGGPTVYSLREVSELVFKARGQSVTIVPLPMPLAKLGMTVMGYIPGIPLGADQFEGLKLDNRVPENDIDAFGVSADELTTFESYLGLEPADDVN